jgi:hypothetical protein
VTDSYFLEVLDTPEVAVLADGSQIEARDSERLCADLGVPAIKAAEVPSIEKNDILRSLVAVEQSLGINPGWASRMSYSRCSILNQA